MLNISRYISLRRRQISLALLTVALFSGCSGGGGGGDTGTSPNRAPTATSASIVTDEDTASAAATPGVTDPDAGDTHTFSIVSQPRNGAATVVGNRLVYTPDLDYNGSDSFTFRATDTGGLAVIGTASVSVVPVNDAPSATGASRAIYSGLAGGGARVPWVDDVDIFDTRTFDIVTSPTNGTASRTGNMLTYLPNPGFTSGVDAFNFRATDSGGTTVDGPMRVVVFGAGALTTCTRLGTVNADGTFGNRPFSHPCAQYQRSETREGSAGTPITIDYIRNWPTPNDTVRGIVVLIGGGDLTTNLAGNDATGAATTSGGNFVVRTAQRFADAGFLTVTLERPSDVGVGSPTVDQYRISAKQAVDIVDILKHTNSINVPVFLVGTSRGAISAVANNVIATGVAIPSPVTSNGGNNALLYVGRADIPSLVPSSVKRPVHILRHQNDACSVSTPADSATLVANLNAAGVSATLDTAIGGAAVTTAIPGDPDHDPDVCGAFDFHGFFGAESTAVPFITNWLNARVDDLGANQLPEAAYVTVPTAAGAAKQIDLARLARDADGDPLSYALSHATTVLGGTVALNGSTVTYTPPVGVTNRTDHFVYVVTDGKGGVRAAVISVKIGT